MRLLHKMILSFLAVTGIVFITMVERGIAQETEKKMEFKYFKEFFDEQPEFQDLAYQRAIDEHKEKIQELIQIVQMNDIDKSRGGTLSIAIGLLKVYRAREATSVLISRLTFLPAPDGIAVIKDARTPPQEYYPAAQALIEIDDPKTPASLSYRIGTSYDPFEREMAAYVILKMLGKERAIALLQASSKRVRIDIQKNYSDAIKFVEDFKPLLDIRPTFTPKKPKEADQK